MADDDAPSNAPDAQRDDAPSDDAVGRRGGAPGYDPSKEAYAGISSGALDHTDDVRAARDFAEMIVDTVREGLLVLDLDLRVKAANESFYQTFAVKPEATVGRGVYDLGNGQWDLPELRELLEGILPHDKIVNDYEVEHAFEGIGRRCMLLNARRLDDHQLILLAIEDVTELRAGEEERRREREKREHAEAVLRKNAAAFRHLADAVPDLVWIGRADGTIFYYSERATRYDGLHRTDDGSWTWAAVLHPEDEEQTAEAWRHAVRTGEPYEVEHRLRMADGAYRWHVSRALPARDSGGDVVRWYGTATDVHRMKESEEARRESEGRYHALFNSMDQGYCVLEVIYEAGGRPVDYRFLETNPAFEEQTGLVDAVGRTAFELVPDLEPHWVETYARVAATGEPLRFEQGSEAMGRWYEVYASRVGGPGSRRVALLFTDVTERKEAERERRLRERRYLELFRQAPAFIAVLRGPDHVFEFANAAYLRLVGERDLLGKPLREALPEVEEQGFIEILDRVVEEGEPFSAVDQPISLRRSGDGDRERRFVDFVYQPLWERDGTISGVIALGVDTTERVRTREALDRANRDLERRVAERTQQVREREAEVRELARALTLAEHEERRRIAHVLHDDLQQVLFAAQMADALGDTGQYKEILTEALRLTRTLSHELSPPLLQEEDLEQLLGWLAEHQRERYGLEVAVEVRDDARVPAADLRVLLYQLLRELLFNVAKHAGTMRARVIAERGSFGSSERVRLIVEDEGAGFDPADLESASNAGLGLPSVRERLELVGGTLEVTSAPGEGTRVTITVPVGG